MVQSAQATFLAQAPGTTLQSLSGTQGSMGCLTTVGCGATVAGMQREISLFKLLGILSAVVGGIVEEAFFRRWVMDMLMSVGFASVTQVIISGVAFGLAHTSWTLAKRDFKFTLPAIISTSVLVLQPELW